MTITFLVFVINGNNNKTVSQDKECGKRIKKNMRRISLPWLYFKKLLQRFVVAQLCQGPRNWRNCRTCQLHRQQQSLLNRDKKIDYLNDWTRSEVSLQLYSVVQHLNWQFGIFVQDFCWNMDPNHGVVAISAMAESGSASGNEVSIPAGKVGQGKWDRLAFLGVVSCCSLFSLLEKICHWLRVWDWIALCFCCFWCNDDWRWCSFLSQWKTQSVESGWSERMEDLHTDFKTKKVSLLWEKTYFIKSFFNSTVTYIFEHDHPFSPKMHSRNIHSSYQE